MQQSPKPETRKKFLLWGIAAFSSLALFKFSSGKKKKLPEPNNETVKMLSQDGKLVEIDKKLIAAQGKKVTNEELQQWIKK